MKIREAKAPQVLQINHDEADDAVSLSGESEVDSDEEFSPLRRDSDNENIQKVHEENHYSEDDPNCKILPSGSSPFTSFFFVYCFACIYRYSTDNTYYI